MSQLSQYEPRVYSLEFIWSFLMHLMVAISRVEVAEHTNLNLPVLVNASTLCVQPCVLVTESVQLLDSQLALVLVKDYHIMVVRIEPSPIIVVRAHVSTA